MFINPVLVLRVLQGVLAFIAMALGASVANVLNTHDPPVDVPGGVIFFVFTAVFTMLVTVPYTILTPRYFPILAHPYAMLAAESITCIFWLAGFAANANLVGKSSICDLGACEGARGSVVLGVFEL
ncbi:uncharacterized protein Z518_00685 [Rhinocladiella mackenziei CBS 650.93]|uniref:Rhinocladiella mackenziei CBS 650.93 unplaced genomic scaffold supercont1.1, whole genome shotgun sequence n=1 Tax=Rhinocladiella mackenziei CBS 650.93 TaxID=1442369 RepID=A0A0D2JJK0_9EURO|nr:uncharacterized protein Z518_00685 [Rhinocladiella mackenziei CBS 650.93]KIX09605.1 hypothetical protein Z518_00685 [Rhinocladiella mackenziei CBS 650.93]